ncbi:hypothetical protein [Ammoniphilus oxalaticus]|uniref:hypothetical protein n=1 Tax=Ammoniphilus oxalaticus TaxID=66863 RepID=UPI001475CD98|nr:hypothetical protein [Ammoniphilus oxalaticus]
MTKRRRNLFLFLFLFTIVFYVYHVRQFGFGSWISMMALASCLSIIGFIHTFLKVGSRA